ncbi:MAG: hypothetical protein IJ617_10085 [Oscillospiraceae bacterium]|nr:hypothetical protein [Oscillospiraceae bacterium]
MALLHLHLNSKFLSGNTDVNIILPELPREEEPKDFYRAGRKFPVLWLLHGTFGDYTDWLRKTNVELYAEEKNLIVVMPSAENTDYANWPGFGTGYRMFDFLTEELMPLVYGWFPASERREDNFIAGLSMGGRGAIMFAYAYPEKFAAVYSMSCVPQDMRPAAADAESDTPPATPWAALDRERTRSRLQNAGGLEGYLASPQNTWDRTAEVVRREGNPKMYFSCGTSDFVMYRHFQKFRAYAQDLGLDAEFIEVEGYGHEWRFWERDIQNAIEKFLPGGGRAGNAF